MFPWCGNTWIFASLPQAWHPAAYALNRFLRQSADSFRELPISCSDWFPRQHANAVGLLLLMGQSLFVLQCLHSVFVLIIRSTAEVNQTWAPASYHLIVLMSPLPLFIFLNVWFPCQQQSSGQEVLFCRLNISVLPFFIQRWDFPPSSGGLGQSCYKSVISPSTAIGQLLPMQRHPSKI